ncbi:MAG: hypothetical protein E7615_02185 [Ruminococcaceae bacterium]|nr:hypothetical protein [Oscillospiraceae bacterium]
MSKNNNKHSHIKKRTVIIAAVTVLLLTVGGVFAKYIYNTDGMNVVSAKEFYFTSNLLAEGNQKYVLNPNPDTETANISFTLGNNADKLRFSQDNISYSVTVETKNGSPVPTVIYSDSEKVLNGGAVDSTTVTLNGLQMGETYTVTATGTAGYKQTLKAEFYVSAKNEVVHKHLDTSNDAFVVLTVWSENVKGELTIEVQKSGLIPDNTDSILGNVYNYLNGSYTEMTGENAISDTQNFTDTYSSYTYRFFVSDSTSYTVSDFNVYIDSNGTIHLADEKTPQ